MNRRIGYRFKTESEFIQEFGHDWRRVVSFNYDGEMDYLIGTDVNVPINCIDTNGNIIKTFQLYCPHSFYGNWAISSEMVKLINLTPEYKPKQLIYE
jgi:hypothetical protein